MSEEPLVLVEETPDGEAVVRRNTKMSENDVLMDLGRQIIGLRREIERYQTREEYFGDILSLADLGRYRADWETAIKRVVAKRDELQKLYDDLLADYDRRSRLAEELSVERDAAMEREKVLREALLGIEYIYIILDYGNDPKCPDCTWKKAAGHASNCTVGKALWPESFGSGEVPE